MDAGPRQDGLGSGRLSPGQPPLSASGRLSASSRSQRPAPGELLADRYELLELLGQGAHGVVFRARDRRVGAEVAVKLVHATGRLGERLVREGQLVSRLDHPGVVRVLDGGERPGGWPYLVLELVRGARHLEDVVPTLGRAGRVECVLAVADALAAAHAQGVVHRDVKAGNVLVDDQGRPRLTDFGIARVTDDDRRDRLTRTGEIVGTPSAMAPEQFQGGPLGPQVDVWALGVLLYELLTDHPPFTGDHPAALFTHVCDRPPIAPRAHDASISPALERVVLGALAKAPGERPADAAAFAEALRAALEARPTGRSPARLIVGIAIGGLVGGAAVAAIGRARHEPPATTATTTTKPPATTTTKPPAPTTPPPAPPPRPPAPPTPPPTASERQTPLERAEALEAAGEPVEAILLLAGREGAELAQDEAARRLARLREAHCYPQHERASADPRWARVDETLRAGHLAGALPLLDALVDDLPAAAILRLARGRVRLLTGAAGGVEDLKASVAFAPRMDAAWIECSAALFQAGDEAGGFDALDRGIVLNSGGGPDLCNARGLRWHTRGQTTRDRADYDRALVDYDRTLDLDPKHPDARLNRASLRAFIFGDPEGATADLEALVGHHGEDVAALTQAGRVYLGLGRSQDALTVLERARGLARDDRDALGQLDPLLEQARRPSPGR